MQTAEVTEHLFWMQIVTKSNYGTIQCLKAVLVLTDPCAYSESCSDTSLVGMHTVQGG